MGFCVGQALCCAGSMCCSMLCYPCGKIGVASKNFARIGYVFFQMLWIGVAISMMFTAKKLVDWLPKGWIHCPDANISPDGTTDHDLDSACLGASSIIRMSFVLFLFHLTVFLIILARNEMAAAFHDGCWMAKSLLVLAGFIGSMWISNPFMILYLNLAKWLSAFFVLYQGLLILIVAYKINGTLVQNYENDETCCSQAILLGFTFVITTINIVWIVLQFMEFGGGNIAIMSVTAVGVVCMYAFVLRTTRPDASILTSAIASSYMLYLQWSALSSDSNKINNPNLDSDSNTVAQIILGLFFTLVCLVIVSSSTKSADETNVTATAGDHLIEKEADLEDKADISEPLNGTSGDKHVFVISAATIYFQFLMALSAMYMSMLCTNWANPTIFGNTTTLFNAGGSAASYWIKLVSLWLTMFVYLFSLVAPLLFPDRDFS